MSKIQELLKQGAQRLKQSDTATPVLDAEVLLVDVLNRYGFEANRMTLVLRAYETIDDNIQAEFFKRIEERYAGKPVQYLTGRQEFMGLDFCVKPGVLIPRPDTEIIVEKMIELYRDKGGVRILDMCTGTGAIAISLAWYLPQADVYAVDLSPIALDCCRENVTQCGLTERVKVISSDLFDSLKGLNLEDSFDLIVSNPPYIKRSDMQTLPISVRGYEPDMALDGGNEGLDFYRRITRDAAFFLKKDAVLAYEIGHDQGQSVSEIINSSGFFVKTCIEKDLAGLDRCVWTRRNGEC